MLDTFRFHHIGMAVRSIEKTALVYQRGGYVCGTTTFDPIQHVNICWLTKEGMPTVELIEPADDGSPVSRLLDKNRAVLYHTCYVVENLLLAIEELRQQHYVLVTQPVEAVAMNGSMACFMFHKDIGLIELTEQRPVLSLS